jgi:hypothetical protein
MSELFRTQRTAALSGATAIPCGVESCERAEHWHGTAIGRAAVVSSSIIDSMVERAYA